LDISGANALISTDDFEKLPNDNRGIYWSKETNGALRIAVRETPFGWRGDMYSLYLLDDAVSKNDFLSNMDSAPSSSPFQLVISDSWRPPLVFQHNESKTKWFIDVGQPFEILGKL
jgi:hypothetical protein